MPAVKNQRGLNGGRWTTDWSPWPWPTMETLICRRPPGHAPAAVANGGLQQKVVHAPGQDEDILPAASLIDFPTRAFVILSALLEVCLHVSSTWHCQQDSAPPQAQTRVGLLETFSCELRKETGVLKSTSCHSCTVLHYISAAWRVCVWRYHRDVLNTRWLSVSSETVKRDFFQTELTSFCSYFSSKTCVGHGVNKTFVPFLVVQAEFLHRSTSSFRLLLIQ